MLKPASWWAHDGTVAELLQGRARRASGMEGRDSRSRKLE